MIICLLYHYLNSLAETEVEERHTLIYNTSSLSNIYYFEKLKKFYSAICIVNSSLTRAIHYLPLRWWWVVVGGGCDYLSGPTPNKTPAVVVGGWWR